MPTRLGVRADEHVIGQGLEVLQWRNRFCKVLDEGDAIHVHQRWAGDFLDQLHVPVSRTDPGPLNITALFAEVLLWA